MQTISDTVELNEQAIYLDFYEPIRSSNEKNMIDSKLNKIEKYLNDMSSFKNKKSTDLFIIVDENGNKIEQSKNINHNKSDKSVNDYKLDKTINESNINLFDNVFFINLDNRIDRLENTLVEFQKLNIVPERVNAIRNKLGALGCTMSHIKCLKLAKQRQLPYVFISEDDISFTDPTTLLNSIKKFVTHKPKWDVLIIGGNVADPYVKITDYFTRVLNVQTTTGYIVASHYYDTLIENYTKGAELLIKNPENIKQYAIDIYWKKLQHAGTWLILTPLTVVQYENHSDIENRVVNYNELMLTMDKKALFAKYNKLIVK